MEINPKLKSGLFLQGKLNYNIYSVLKV